MRIKGAEKCLHQVTGITLEELYTAGIHFSSNEYISNGLQSTAVSKSGTVN